MLAYLNIDRLLTFKYPLKYKLSRKRAIIINIVIWVVILASQLPNALVTMDFIYSKYSFVCLPIWKRNTIYKFAWLGLPFVISTIINIVCFCGSFYLIRSRHKSLSTRGSHVRVHYGRQASDNPDSRWGRDKRTFKVLAIMSFGE